MTYYYTDELIKKDNNHELWKEKKQEKFSKIITTDFVIYSRCEDILREIGRYKTLKRALNNF